MAGSIYNIGVSALNASQVSLATAEHNIANANTPGFNRQEVGLAVRQAQYTGSGFIGQGVDAVTVKRLYNEFIGRQVLQEQGLSSQLNTYYAQIQQIDNMLADNTVGLSPSLQGFFSSIQDVATNPSSTSSFSASMVVDRVSPTCGIASLLVNASASHANHSSAPRLALAPGFN